MKKVITTMLVAAMVLSMAVPTSAATITRKKSTGTSASTTKVSGDYSLKMVDKTLQFIRGGKVVSSIETKDGKITLRKSSAGGISVVFTDANGKRRNITLGKQDSVSLSGTFTQVSVDKALGSSFEVEMEKGSKVTNFYAKGAAKVTLNGSVTTLNVTSSNANVAANGTVSRAYAVNKKAITGMSSGKITQTSTGTSASGSVNTSTGSSSSSNTTVNSGSGSSGSSSSGSSGIIINGGGSNNGGNTTSKRNPKVTASSTAIPTYDEGTVLNTISLTQFGLKAMYGNTEVAGTFSWNNPTSKVAKGTYTYRINFTPKDTKTYNSATINVKIEGKEVVATQTLAEAKKAIEDRLAALSVDNTVTKETIQALADNEIKSGSGIKAVADVTVVKATETTEGTIKGTITLTKGTETATVTVDLKIAKLSALDAAKADVEAALNSFTATKETTKADVEAALDAIDKKYTSVTITVEKFDHDEANKTFNTEVKLVENGVEKTVTKALTYTDGSEEGEAKAPTFTKDPAAPATGSNVTLSKDTPVTLEVAANVDGSTDGITYQWYRSTSSLVDNASARVAIDGATSATYTLAPEDEGRYYFFAEAIHTVGDKTASSFSKNVLLTVTVPEGSAVAKPEFTTNLGNKNESVAVGVQKVLTIDTKAVTLPTKTTYQWYMSTDPENPLNGTAISGETGKTLTVKNNTIGVTSYYCVATNTTTADVDFNNRTATSEYTTITVTSSIGFSAASVDKGTEGTTAIDVTFTKDITGLGAENFKVEGKKDSATGPATPTITVDRVESFTDNLKKYTLHVSGIDLNGIATVTVVPPAGITVSDPKVQEVNITAPTEVVSVTGFSVAKTSDEGETTQLKVTFDKAISSAASSYVVAMTSEPNIVTGANVDPADDHSVLLDVELSNVQSELEATLTTANGTALATADQKKVDVTRDKKAPTVTSINLGSDNKQIELAMSEPLADATLDETEFTLVNKTTGAPVLGAPTIDVAKIDASTNNTMIVLTASTPVDVSTLKLKYTAVTPINDRAAAPNALAAFTEAIEGTVLPDTLTVQAVEVTAANKAVVKMNAPIVSTADPAELQNLFVAKDQKTGTLYTIASVTPITASKGRAVTQSINGFEITFNPALPAGAVVVISINPSATDVADKIAIAGKPDAKLPVNQPPVVAPEVKAVSATVADVEVAGKKGTAITATDVVITLADGGFTALAQGDDVSGWFKNLPTALAAEVKTAVAEGEKTVTITISGQPSEAKAEAMKIEIPKTAIVDATENLTVTNNAKAKFAIVDDTPAAALNASFAAESTLEAPIAANTKVGAITATGGTSPYNYVITPNSDIDGYFQVTGTGEVQAAKQLIAGTYTCKVTVTDDAATPEMKEVNVSITVTSAGTASATVDNKTVSGTVNAQITPVDVTIELTNDKFNALTANDSVKGWFNLPNGLDAKVKTTVVQDATTAVITISGTPTVTSSAAMVINIPTNALASGVALKVTDNADAKYDIKDATPTPATTINLSAAPSATTVGSTTVTTTTTVTSGNSLKYTTSNASISNVNVGDTPAGTPDTFTSPQEIAITDAGTYVHVYELDSENKVVGYGEHEVAGDEIKCSVDSIALTSASLATGSANAGATAATISTGYTPTGVTYTLSGTDGAKFAVNGDKINIAASQQGTLGDGTYTITIRATDDANGAYYEESNLTITIDQ